MISSLSLLLAIALGMPPAPPVFVGTERQTRVAPPRLADDGARVDGVLDEAQWRAAAVLTGFSQYFPRDGTAPSDSTQVLVWYSASAIHFGIRAFEAHGAPRTALSSRDKIDEDDRVELLVGTFHDGRQATVLAVNPLGVQMDGTLVETNQMRGGGSGTTLTVRESPDLTPDFVFQSRGRLTDFGYEVEVRVPFRSLKYADAKKVTWNLNVVRRIQHAGEEDTWAPTRQASASFLRQSGELTDLTGLARGLVVDATPEITSRTTGARDAAGAWRHEREPSNVGATLRWGISSNATLNATVNPDFSQIESDAGQIQSDPRQALLYPEKRPFFLDGNEYFATPKNLVYTRRIVQPVAALKLTAKRGATNVGLLSVVDDRPSPGSERPVFAIARVQRDVGAHSRLGVTYTDRTAGPLANRVGAIDARHVFGGVYSLQGQFAQSFTRTSASAPTRAAPLWNGVLSRNGKRLAFRYAIDGVSERFRTQSGFISRGGLVIGLLDQRFTHFFGRGTLLETITYNPLVMYSWRYAELPRGRDALEKKLHNRLAVTARGGWTADVTLMNERFGFDSVYYGAYRVVRGVGDTIPLRGPSIPNTDVAVSFATPNWRRFTGGMYYLWGRDENFFEWSSARIVYALLETEVRPTERVRIGATYARQGYVRRSDGSAVGESRIPRGRVEYQISPALFVRLIGEYRSNFQDALRDDGRTDGPLLVRGAPQPRGTTSAFAQDVLVSYRPTPGTVLFLGYGAGFDDVRQPAEQFAFPRSLGFAGLRRTSDAVYLKASYAWRL